MLFGDLITAAKEHIAIILAIILTLAPIILIIFKLLGTI